MTKKKNIEPLNLFVDKLIEEKGFHGLEPEVMQQIKVDLLKRVDDHLNAAIINHLPESELGQFTKLLESQKGPSEIQAFCDKHILDFNKVVASTLLKFRKIYLGG